MVLGVPQHKVTVRCKRTGGGFGGKERLLLSAEMDTNRFSRCFPALMAAIAAVSLRRPVRFVLTREVDTATTGHRCFLEMDSSVITLFDPGMRQVLPSNSVSTARGDSSLLDLIWPSMPAAPATSQSPGLTH